MTAHQAVYRIMFYFPSEATAPLTQLICAKKNWNPIFSHTSAPPDLGLAVGWECLVEEAAPGDLLHVGTKALDNWIITC